MQTAKKHRANDAYKRVLISAAAFVDHFDTALYSFCAPLLAPLFFPSQPPAIRLTLAYSVFLVGLIGRPLGSYMAYKASFRQGRLERCWPFSLLILGLAMLAISFLPTYARWGLWAPCMLFVLRGIMDIAVAFERTFARFWLIEDLPHKEATRWTSTYTALGVAGLGMASASADILRHHTLPWQLLFCLGGGACVMLGCLRFLCRAHKHVRRGFATYADNVLKISLWHILKKQKKLFLSLTLLHGFSYSTYVVVFVFFPVFLPLALPHITLHPLQTSWLFVFDILLALLLGRFCHRWPLKHVMRVAVCCFGLTGFVGFLLLPDMSSLHILWLRIGLMLWGILFSILLPLWEKKHTQEETERYALCSMGKIVGSSLLGRNLMALLIASYHITGSFLFLGLILMIISGLALYSLYANTFGRAII